MLCSCKDSGGLPQDCGSNFELKDALEIEKPWLICVVKLHHLENESAVTTGNYLNNTYSQLFRNLCSHYHQNFSIAETLARYFPSRKNHSFRSQIQFLAPGQPLKPDGHFLSPSFKSIMIWPLLSSDSNQHIPLNVIMWFWKYIFFCPKDNLGSPLSKKKFQPAKYILEPIYELTPLFFVIYIHLRSCVSKGLGCWCLFWYSSLVLVNRAWQINLVTKRLM